MTSSNSRTQLETTSKITRSEVWLVGRWEKRQARWKTVLWTVTISASDAADGSNCSEPDGNLIALRTPTNSARQLQKSVSLLQQGGRRQRCPVILGVVGVCKRQDWRLDQVPCVTHDRRFLCHRHGTVWYLVQDLVETDLQQQQRRRQPIYGTLSRTTRASRYQKKHSHTHIYHDHQPSFINVFQPLWSIASSLYNLHAWQSLHNLSPGLYLDRLSFT